MGGIQLVTDDKGRKTAVLIDLKKHGSAVQDFWDCLSKLAAAKRTSLLTR